MAQVVDGRYTARMDEPFAVFMIGMWLAFHKDPASIDRRMIQARSTEVPHNIPTVQPDWETTRSGPAVEKRRGCK